MLKIMWFFELFILRRTPLDVLETVCDVWTCTVPNYYTERNAIPYGNYLPTCTVKKVHEFPVSSRDVTNQTPPGQE